MSKEKYKCIRSFAELAEAFKIFGKYLKDEPSQLDRFLDTENNCCLGVDIRPEKVSKKDKKRLEELGWTILTMYFSYR